MLLDRAACAWPKVDISRHSRIPLPEKAIVRLPGRNDSDEHSWRKK